MAAHAGIWEGKQFNLLPSCGLRSQCPLHWSGGPCHGSQGPCHLSRVPYHWSRVPYHWSWGPLTLLQSPILWSRSGTTLCVLKWPSSCHLGAPKALECQCRVASVTSVTLVVPPLFQSLTLSLALYGSMPLSRISNQGGWGASTVEIT